MDFRDRQIGELSGGQKKRVFLARSLAQGGKVMLLDEPFTGVDVKTENAIIEHAARAAHGGAYYFSVDAQSGVGAGVLRSGGLDQPDGAGARGDGGCVYGGEPRRRPSAGSCGISGWTTRRDGTRSC